MSPIFRGHLVSSFEFERNGKRYRWENELTQAQLAKRWGITQSTLQRWENATMIPSGAASFFFYELLAARRRAGDAPIAPESMNTDWHELTEGFSATEVRLAISLIQQIRKGLQALPEPDITPITPACEIPIAKAHA